MYMGNTKLQGQAKTEWIKVQREHKSLLLCLSEPSEKLIKSIFILDYYPLFSEINEATLKTDMA